ncbi:MAG TPA: Ldh family oxidoreductase [Thermomicrobiales bacterium]
MPTVLADTLRDLMRAIFEAVGTPPDTARFVGDSLVDANLAGHDSHGVIRILHYVEMVRAGKVDPRAEPCVVHRFGATATLDANWGWGQPAMMLATETAIELARQYGLGAAVVRRCYHIGRVAPYVETIARAGMIGIATTNAGPAVAPYGARSRVLGTNPIAWAAPRADGKEPICLDIATAAVAEGKLRVARAKGAPAPPGAIVNVEGHPSLDPNDFYAGGALLPFGAHKGSGLSVLVQILGRGLASMDRDQLLSHRGGNGPFVLAIDPAAFGPREAFIEAVEAQCAEITSATPAEGFDAVLLPGEPELAARAERLANGIPVPETTWNELLALAAELGIGVAGPAQASPSQ